MKSRLKQHHREWLLRLILPLVTLAVLVGVWAAFASSNSPYVLPGPDRVWRAFLDNWQSGYLQPNILTTLQESVLGWLIGITIALPLGYLIGRWRYLEWAVSPYLAGVQAVPVLAIAPLLLIWVGLGIELKIVLAAIISFFPLLTTTVLGLRSISGELRDVARTSGARWWQTLVYLEAPLSARSMFAGARIAILLAVVGAYVGELLNADQGLGAVVVTQNQSVSSQSTAIIFVAVVLFFVMSAALYSILLLVEKGIVRWTE